jgi:hypothetical protein
MLVLKRHRRHRQSARSGYTEYQVSPFAPPDLMTGPKRAIGLFSLCLGLVKSGITGFSDDSAQPLAWYDRAIRFAGGILLLTVFGTGLVLLAIETFRK